MCRTVNLPPTGRPCQGPRSQSHGNKRRHAHGASDPRLTPSAQDMGCPCHGEGPFRDRYSNSGMMLWERVTADGDAGRKQSRQRARELLQAWGGLRRSR